MPPTRIPMNPFRCLPVLPRPSQLCFSAPVSCSMTCWPGSSAPVCTPARILTHCSIRATVSVIRPEVADASAPPAAGAAVVRSDAAVGSGTEMAERVRECCAMTEVTPPAGGVAVPLEEGFMGEGRWGREVPKEPAEVLLVARERLEGKPLWDGLLPVSRRVEVWEL